MPGPNKKTKTGARFVDSTTESVGLSTRVLHPYKSVAMRLMQYSAEFPVPGDGESKGMLLLDGRYNSSASLRESGSDFDNALNQD